MWNSMDEEVKKTYGREYFNKKVKQTVEIVTVWNLPTWISISRSDNFVCKFPPPPYFPNPGKMRLISPPPLTSDRRDWGLPVTTPWDWFLTPDRMRLRFQPPQTDNWETRRFLEAILYRNCHIRNHKTCVIGEGGWVSKINQSSLPREAIRPSGGGGDFPDFLASRDHCESRFHRRFHLRKDFFAILFFSFKKLHNNI